MPRYLALKAMYSQRIEDGSAHVVYAITLPEETPPPVQLLYEASPGFGSHMNWTSISSPNKYFHRLKGAVLQSRGLNALCVQICHIFLCMLQKRKKERNFLGLCGNVWIMNNTAYEGLFCIQLVVPVLLWYCTGSLLYM